MDKSQICINLIIENFDWNSGAQPVQGSQPIKPRVCIGYIGLAMS